MRLEEMLLELRENMLHDRSDRISGAPDYLWSDTTLIRYIDEAQNQFARQTWCIRDGVTAAVTQVTLSTDQVYPLHPKIIAVLSARLEGDTTDLARGHHTAFDTFRQQDALFFDANVLNAVQPGKPVAYDLDEYFVDDATGSSGCMALRVYPTPSSTYVGQKIFLRVVRMPLNSLAGVNLSAYPEIPSEYHFTILDYAAYLALRMPDHDAEDTARADRFLASFQAKVAQAKHEIRRKTFAPTLWGFGRNGFSWEGN